MLSRIGLQNFRNYNQISVSTGADLVLILGDNAAGKTNFLESIYFLSVLKSFRAPDQFLVRIGQDFFNLNAEVGDKKLEAVVQVNPRLVRQFKINGQKTSRALWQSFRTVLFIPNDLNLFTLGPVMRRKFMDEILSQKSQDYALATSSLDHVLKQKSALLENLNHGYAGVEELDFWNDQLAELSIQIHTKRRALSEYINNSFRSIHEGLTGFDTDVVYIYKSQVENLDKESLLIKLKEHREAEIRSGKNLIGPHKDDFTLEKNKVLNIYSSSRGELRSQILTLKLLEAQYLSDEQQKPVILLDDVFSELDETRRTKLIEGLSGHQIFITSTEEHHLPKLAKNSLVLKVEANEIK